MARELREFMLSIHHDNVPMNGHIKREDIFQSNLSKKITKNKLETDGEFDHSCSSPQIVSSDLNAVYRLRSKLQAIMTTISTKYIALCITKLCCKALKRDNVIDIVEKQLIFYVYIA